MNKVTDAKGKFVDGVEMCMECNKRPVMHESFRWWVDPSRSALCCQCNAKDETSDAADWHKGCVSAWNREERKRNIAKHGSEKAPEQKKTAN